jgi:hypothetical protein
MYPTSALNIPDCHIPWHDKKAYEVMLLVAKDLYEAGELSEINIMGDFLDFYGFSLHPKGPSDVDVEQTLKDEVYWGIKKLQELRANFPKAKINFIEGNHEYRLMRYIVDKCPELYDFFTLPELLKFDQLDIKYHPYCKAQLVSCLGTDYYLRHKPYSAGENCAGGTMKKKFRSLGFGHTHRTQTYAATDALGKVLECRSLGWLGDRTAPIFEYVDHDHWTQGFEIVTALNKNEWFAEYVSIKQGKAVWRGFIYEG